MNFTSKAKKAGAAILAASTVLWSVSFLAVPLASAAAHGSGCLVNISGTVYLINGGQRRGFTSAEVFMSHGYNFGQVVAGNSDDSDLNEGAIMVYADGTLVKGPNDPLVYLVVNGQKRGFTSGSVFTGLGYSFANIQWAPVNTFSDLPTGSNIDSTSISGLPASGPGMQSVNCTTGSGPGAGLGSGEGDITSVTETATEDSSAPEGETSEVFGFEAEIEGDVQIDRVDVYIEVVTSGGGASANPDDYFEGAMLMVDGDEVADLDASDFNDDTAWGVVTDGATADDEYRLRFSNLGLNFADGDMPEFIVAFDASSVIDSDDQAGDWRIDLETDSIRFVDGRGFSDTAGAALSEDFGIDAEDTAELTVQSSSNDPEASVIEVSDDDTTEGAEIFVFEIEEENGVDVTINDLTVTATALTNLGAAADESAVMEDAHLYQGSELLDSVSVAAGGALSFEDLDLDIDADDTIELTLKVDLADVDGYGEGYTVSATVAGATDIDDAEDANGNDEGDITPTGTATSATHELRTAGIMLEFVGADAERTFTADATGEDDQGTYTIEFDVTAFGDDAYIDKGSELGMTNFTGTYTLANAAVLAAETYTATINATAVVYTATAGDAAGSDDVDTLAIMNGLAAAIDANATVGPLVNAYASDNGTTSVVTLEAVLPGTAYTTTAADTSVGGTLVATQASLATDDAAGQGVEFFMSANAGTPTLSSDLLESDTTEVEDTNDTFFVEEGTTRSFSLIVIYTADTLPQDGSATVFMKSLNWDPEAADTTPDNFYIFDLNDFKTGALFLNGIA